MFKGGIGFTSVLAFGLLLAASCGSKDQCHGGERCACYANDTCNAGLECRSNLCVSTQSGTGGSSSFDVDACFGCAEKTCKAEYDACNGASGCLDLVECALGCGSDVNCVTACSKSINADTGQKLAAYESCALTRCLDDCVATPVGSGGSGGAGGSGGLSGCLACGEKTCKTEYGACKATSGCVDLLTCVLDCGSNSSCLSGCGKGVTVAAAEKLATYQTCTVTQCAKDCAAAGAGGSSNGNGGSSAGGTSHGGSTAGGSSAGSGQIPPVDDIDWLTLEGAAAPSAEGVNGILGIEGVFYAYGDACATAQMQWDPDTRCLSGELCVADQTGTNWGVAIGFDLNNVAEVKHAWDATSARATGFAWRVSGSPLPRLQFWVQNMDPAFSGTCSAATCSIDGPPDGVKSAAATAELPFASMVKDDWGGTGTFYSFNPGNISSLQFKVPAVLDPLATSYQICVENLGVMH